MTGYQDGVIIRRMTLRRAGVENAAVPVIVVVPTH